MMLNRDFSTILRYLKYFSVINRHQFTTHLPLFLSGAQLAYVALIVQIMNLTAVQYMKIYCLEQFQIQ